MIEKIDVYYLYVIFVNLMGFFVVLVCGMIWLKISGDFIFIIVFVSGLLFFLLLEVIKVIGVVYIGVLLKKWLN